MGANQSASSDFATSPTDIQVTMERDDDIIMLDKYLADPHHIDPVLPAEIFKMLEHPDADPPLISIHDEKNIGPMVPNTDGHIYLIREREFVHLGQPVYKIGKTGQPGLKRAKQYPKNSEIEIHLRVSNYHLAEVELIATFKREFKHRDDIGAEYFEGDKNRMVDLIYSYRAIHAVAPSVQAAKSKSQSEDDAVFVLECAFAHLWQHMRRIVTHYYAPEMDGAFLEHMIFLITGIPGGDIHGSTSLPVSSDRPAPTVDLGKFRAVLGKMYSPGAKKPITCDQYRRHVHIHNILTQAHPLVVQYEVARRATARPERYPEIKMAAALEITDEVFNATSKKCYDYEYIMTKARIRAGTDPAASRRRSRQS